MKVVVSGATGFVGRRLVAQLGEGGHDVVALSRSAEKARSILGEDVAVEEVDPYDAEALAEVVRGADAVVNLAGENIFDHRWSKKFMQAIRDSRVETTRAFVTAFASLAPQDRPRTFLNASAVGCYGPREPGDIVDENTMDADVLTPPDFLSEVCIQWERVARDAERYGLRTIRLRIGVVLGPGGGALDEIEKPFKAFVGGPIGSGRQMMSWIHIEDLCRLAVFCLEQDGLRGPVNAVAPNPVSNKDFSKTLARVLHRPCLLPVPPFALRIVLGKVASVVTTGQHVIPLRAREHDFTFRHSELEAALRAIYEAEEQAAAPSQAATA